MRYRHPDTGLTVPETSGSGFSLTISDADLALAKQKLTEEEARVLLRQGTEPPFCGGLVDTKDHGVYHCRLCALPLFSSAHKFHSGTGWPSFYQGVDPAHIRYVEDSSHGMWRVEIRCQRCDGHLGHVFPDGPPPNGWRYCVNSISLVFSPEA